MTYAEKLQQLKQTLDERHAFFTSRWLETTHAGFSTGDSMTTYEQALSGYMDAVHGYISFTQVFKNDLVSPNDEFMN